MKSKKIYAVLGTSLVWGAFLVFTPTSRAQAVGELSDSSSSILALCNCTSSAEAAQSPNCKALLAAQNPEAQRAPSQQSPGVHSLMGTNPGMTIPTQMNQGAMNQGG